MCIRDSRNIARGGVGVNWHRSFNTFEEFFRGRHYLIRKQEEEAEKQRQADSIRDSFMGVGTQ